MLRFALRHAHLDRWLGAVPVVALLLAADILQMLWRHLTMLDAAQRRRLLALVRQAHGRPSSLGELERQELAGLLARLEPRVFAGSAIRRVSPVPLPKRLLYGPRGSATRSAAVALRRRERAS
jgi:hypothetical protein